LSQINAQPAGARDPAARSAEGPTVHVLIVYATTEGHTRDLAHFMMRTLAADGQQVAVEEAPRAAPYPDPAKYAAVFVAGSLHQGRYQPRLVRFAHARHAELARTHAAFVSVSLAAAGVNPDDWAGLEECVARFEHETEWTPAAVHQAAGAIRYSQYDFFKRLVLQHIAAKRGHKTTTSHDYDLTDYDALARFCREFVATSPEPPAGAPQRAL
jgi:menaquinone-dependent protoporphyrinogen oxidase